jgi:hypothetical protein
LHKTDNFHFAHLLVVVYEADQIRQAIIEGDYEASALTKQTMYLLLDFIISFIQQNRLAIKVSLSQNVVSPIDNESL